MTQSTTITQLRGNLKKYLDDVSKSDDVIIDSRSLTIPTRRDQPSTVNRQPTRSSLRAQAGHRIGQRGFDGLEANGDQSNQHDQQKWQEKI